MPFPCVMLLGLLILLVLHLHLHQTGENQKRRGI